jgi:CRP-like cAMP-binding protein
MVSESALFHRFNPARLLNLRDTLKFVALEAGDVLFNEGDSIDSFFLLVPGSWMNGARQIPEAIQSRDLISS